VSSELLGKLYNIEGEVCRIPLDIHLERIGNLNYERFEQIMSFIAIDVAKYVPRKQLIDESLVEMRNKIAHGQHLTLDSEGLKDLSDEVLVLIRWVKTDIENAVTTKSYLA
jgi:hypothetical protein